MEGNTPSRERFEKERAYCEKIKELNDSKPEKGKGINKDLFMNFAPEHAELQAMLNARRARRNGEDMQPSYQKKRRIK